jgi:hypothetical protein
MKRILSGLILLLGGAPLWCAPPAPETGFFLEVAVRQPTRLDWEFVAGTFGPEAARIPADYHSAENTYQLFVPPAYKPGRPAGLVLFVSPGDDPLGWTAWQKACNDRDLFFAAPYGAGGSVAPGRRVRILLDVLDDVRRRYAIDPAHTYAAGFDNGAAIAGTIACALPEYFGGVIAISGGAASFRLDYLRHRAQDRLSVAVVAGADDSHRSEIEKSFYPLLQDLGIRSRLWVVRGLGHALPPLPIVSEVQGWLASGLPRLQDDARDHPGLTVAPEEALTKRVAAEKMLADAEAQMHKPDRLYRAAALLLGVTTRWDGTDAAERARKLLQEIHADPERRHRLAEQAGPEERRALVAQARALDRLGDAEAAQQAWLHLGKAHPGTPEAAIAAAEARRLSALAAATPFLGVQFVGQSTVVHSVLPHGPADRAGLGRGDRILKMGTTATPTLTELRSALKGVRPGDKVPIEVQREGRAVTLTLEAATPPEKD